MPLEKSASLQSLPALSPPEGEKEPPNLTFIEKIKLIFSNITVEPIMVCYILPCVMAALSAQNLSLEKACRVNLAMEESICDALTVRNNSGYSKADEEEVQKLVAEVAAWKNVILSVIPSLLLMFLGSWSDRHNRRKPVMLLPIIGEVIATGGFLVCTYFFYQLPLQVNAVAEVLPPALTGSWYAMYVGVFSYVSYLSTPDTRTVRIGAVSMFSNVSVTVGIALSGIMYKTIGFYGVFSLSLLMYFTGLVYGYFAVHEEPSKVNTEKNTLADFFDLKYIKETMYVAFKSGENSRKKKILTIMILVMVICGPLNGKINSLFGVCEALMPLVYAPMYSKVYADTINVFPGTFFLLGGLLTLPAVFIFLWLYFETKEERKKEGVDGEEKERMLEKQANGHVESA